MDAAAEDAPRPIPAAADARVEIIEGVTIHRGSGGVTRFASADDGTIVRVHRMNKANDGVRVHRGAAPTDAVAAAEPVPAPSAAGAVVATH